MEVDRFGTAFDRRARRREYLRQTRQREKFAIFLVGLVLGIVLGIAIAL